MKTYSSYKNILFIYLLVLTFIACKADRDGEDNSGDDTNGGNTQLDLEISSSTNSRGLANITFNTAKDVSKLSVSAQGSRGKSTRISKLTVGGTDYLSPKGETVSLANDFAPILTTATVPSRDLDPALNSPQEVLVSAEVESTNSNSNNSEQVLFKVTSRTDKNLSSGSLKLNIFYVGAIGAEASTKSAIAPALEIASNIFSNGAGINLSITEKEIGGPVNLPLPTNGDKLYETNSTASPSPAVNVFIGGDIEDISGDGSVLGLSASIPGPPTPTLKSAVVISVFSSAGSDGIFDSEDIRILGETIAHESGHYMGLFHPVDLSGSIVVSSDPLTDTPGCSFLTECVTNNNLVSNLMFPNPIQDGNGGFLPQNNLTSQQRSVLNRYAAVN